MLRLRDARLEDADLLCEAERQVVSQFDGMLVSEPDELVASSFRERIKSIEGGRGKYLVVEDEGAIVAHACLWPMGLKKVAHVLRLDMCVHVGHWRQGHGRRLIDALIAWAATRSNARKIELLVRSENAAAIALYLNAGFVEEGKLRDRVRLRTGRYIDDISMAMVFAARDA